MHILMLPGWMSTRWFPNPVNGIFFLEQAHLMRHLGDHKVNVLYPQVTGAVGYWWKHQRFPLGQGLEISDSDGMEIWVMYRPCWTPRWIRNRQVAMVSAFRQMWVQYTARHGRPDVLWVQSASGIRRLMAQYVSVVLDIPYFVVEHSGRFLCSSALSYRRQCDYRKVFSNALFVAAVSDFLRKPLSLLCPDCSVLHNPVLQVFFQSGNTRPVGGPYLFVSTGRLEKGKGHEIVIAAFARLLSTGANCRLIIMGDGSLLPDLRRQTREAGIAEQVVFSGFLDRKALVSNLLGANAYVSASAYETFNLSLAEALVCGLPCVATPTGVAPDVIDGKNGVLTAGFNEEEIYHGMRTVYEGKYDNNVIAEAAKQWFSPQYYVDTLTSLIKSHIALRNQI